MGLTLKEAQVAAGVETTVVEMQESRRKLYDAAKGLGLTDAQADAFSTRP
jgi:ABC-type proline/glycine betaine transport system permease subunit